MSRHANTSYSAAGDRGYLFPVRASFSPSKSRPREYLVLDFETTGLDPFSCEVIEMACVRVYANRITGKFESLVKPEGLLSNRIVELTGITDDMLADAPSLDEAVAGLAEFVGKRKVPIFAHNAPFDARVIWANGIADSIEPDCPLYCSLELSRRAYPKEQSHSLDSLAKSLGLIRFDAHRALGDCLCTAQLIDVCYRETDLSAVKVKGMQGQISVALTLPPCPRCGSNLIARDGFTQAGSQMYRCKECNKKYSEKTKNASRRKRTVPTFSEAKSANPEGLLSCKHCGSTNLAIKDHRSDAHRYRCKDCRRTTTFLDG